MNAPTEEEQASKRQRRSGPKSTTNYIGVTQYKKTGKYEAHVWISNTAQRKGFQKHLGSYNSPEKASLVYDLAILKLRGNSHTGLNHEESRNHTLLKEHLKMNPMKFLDLLRELYSIKPGQQTSKEGDGERGSGGSGHLLPSHQLMPASKPASHIIQLNIPRLSHQRKTNGIASDEHTPHTQQEQEQEQEYGFPSSNTATTTAATAAAVTPFVEDHHNYISAPITISGLDGLPSPVNFLSTRIRDHTSNEEELLIANPQREHYFDFDFP